MRLQIGHAGTLDPNATGLLIVCVNKGTKGIENFVGQEKEYEGESISSVVLQSSGRTSFESQL